MLRYTKSIPLAMEKSMSLAEEFRTKKKSPTLTPIPSVGLNPSRCKISGNSYLSHERNRAYPPQARLVKL